MAGRSVGERLPELAIPISRTLIVAGAMATQDFEDVHHDPALAVERGTPDTYMSINNTNGLVCRYLTDWAGPHAFIRRIKTRLGVPNFPGDTMTFTGEVTEVDGAEVTVKVIGANSLGAHATSTVTLTLTGAA